MPRHDIGSVDMRRIVGFDPMVRACSASFQLGVRSGCRRIAVVLAVAGLAALFAATAYADGYWNVWQNYLPDSNGVRTKYTLAPLPSGGTICAYRGRVAPTTCISR